MTKSPKALLAKLKAHEDACLSKLEKTSFRINILEQYLRDADGVNVSLKDWLRGKGLDYKTIFAPIGWCGAKGVAVSHDPENKHLMFCRRMMFHPKVGYPLPSREMLSDKQHGEVTSSIFGYSYNPHLAQYFPTTPENTYYDARVSSDMDVTDIMGGLRLEEIGNLNAVSQTNKEITRDVVNFLIEELDNVEEEVELVYLNKQDILRQAGLEEYSNVESGKNLFCRSGCVIKHPLSRKRQDACEEACDEKYQPSQKQQERRDDRQVRKDARQEKREEIDRCRDAYKAGRISKEAFKQCKKDAKVEKMRTIEEAGATSGWTKLGRTFNRVNPITAGARGAALQLVKWNFLGVALRLYPAFATGSDASKFTPEAISGARRAWSSVSRAWKNLGGKPDKLKDAIIVGGKKKVLKESDAGIDGYSNAEGVSLGAIITAGGSVVAAILNLIATFVGRNPYKQGAAPPSFRAEDIPEDVPPVPGEPCLNDRGDWIDCQTGEVIDPKTGQRKILGMPESYVWYGGAAIAVIVTGLLIYRATRKKK